jgi:hypothetical protein
MVADKGERGKAKGESADKASSFDLNFLNHALRRVLTFAFRPSPFPFAGVLDSPSNGVLNYGDI